MSLRLDPRRLGQLKQLAGDAGMRPGDLVRQWVEERIDAERTGTSSAAPTGLADRFAELVERVAALEIAAGITHEPRAAEVAAEPAAGGTTDTDEADRTESSEPAAADETPAPAPKPTRAVRTKRVAASPSERVALHDEMIAVIRERGPLPAGELAAAINERGR